jgi:threonine dehydratase
MDGVDLDRARAATAASVVRTPLIVSEELGELGGGTVALKCECLQRTGSFKLRGALTKIAALGQDAGAGLVTASAGNHGRAVAQAARIRGRRSALA